MKLGHLERYCGNCGHQFSRELLMSLITKNKIDCERCRFINTPAILSGNLVILFAFFPFVFGLYYFLGSWNSYVLDAISFGVGFALIRLSAPFSSLKSFPPED